MPTAPPPPQVVTDYFTMLNADDLEVFADLWTADATLVAFGRDGRRTRTGRKEVLGYYDQLFAPWASHHDEVLRAVVATVGTATTVTVEIRFTGRTRDGRPVAFDALDVFDVEQGRIARLSIWHDVLTTRRLLRTGHDTPGRTTGDA